MQFKLCASPAHEAVPEPVTKLSWAITGTTKFIIVNNQTSDENLVLNTSLDHNLTIINRCKSYFRPPLDVCVVLLEGLEHMSQESKPGQLPPLQASPMWSSVSLWPLCDLCKGWMLTVPVFLTVRRSSKLYVDGKGKDMRCLAWWCAVRVPAPTTTMVCTEVWTPAIVSATKGQQVTWRSVMTTTWLPLGLMGLRIPMVPHLQRSLRGIARELWQRREALPWM